MVALTPVPTIKPATTRELGNDLTWYAIDASVAIVSLVIAAIRSLGSAPNLRLLEGGDIEDGDCLRVCRTYPDSSSGPKSRFDDMLNPFPIGIRVAAVRSVCLRNH